MGIVSTEAKGRIKKVLESMSIGNLTDASCDLFKALGYNAIPFNLIDSHDADGFMLELEGLLDDGVYNSGKLHKESWKYADYLFQLNENNLSTIINKDTHDKGTVYAYNFLTIELVEGEYSRRVLNDITRELNKRFAAPTMVIYKVGDKISLSIIDRRLNKRNEDKHVLSKVTLIKDIDLLSPHRAHIEILSELSLPSSNATSFIDLHKAWKKTLDTKELNIKFYKEIANWYYWAMDVVIFPENTKLIQNDADEREITAKSLIKFLTRILFVWFIKEKKLVSPDLFDPLEISNLLNNFGPTGHDSSYYKAILQNLFFGVLNQEIGKRAFRNKSNRGIHNLFRYESQFKDKEKFVELVNKTPFLNGGLFECMDNITFKEVYGKKVEDTVTRIDGFTDEKNNKLSVPNHLFFANESVVDLSATLGAKAKNSKVQGLFNILNKYKFTIAESTPIDQDIALDPELLGNVFENLLASFNPETQSTARKSTGSYYTPKEIVNYMVDESLKQYLHNCLHEKTAVSDEDIKVGLEILFMYTEKDHAFDDNEVDILIDSINNCKILDPACGSGAFPMGALHKLVYVLHKLDPDNSRWRDKQIAYAEQIEDSERSGQAVKDIIKSFKDNDMDYARKLYLIDKCIYGVDIQPIAMQISKLRFFISLMVEQHVDFGDIKNNYKVHALPNLETHFVCANTLIDLPSSGSVADSFYNSREVKNIETAIARVRKRMFSAKGRKFKDDCREEEKTLRGRLGQLLIINGENEATVDMITAWDPYDQNASSPFFNPQVMYGIKDGFDIVIGNPPYFNVQSLGAKNPFILEIQRRYNDIWMDKSDILFYFIAFAEKTSKGVVSFITSNAFLFSDKAQKLRNLMVEKLPIRKMINFEKHMPFDSALITCCIAFWQKDFVGENLIKNIKSDKVSINEVFASDNWHNVEFEKNKVFALADNSTRLLLEKIDKNTTALNKIVKVGKGMETASNSIFATSNNNLFDSKYMKKRITGESISKYILLDKNNYIIYYEFEDQFEDLDENLREYLLANKEILSQRATVKNEGKAWWRYSRALHKDFYDCKKIWCSYRAKENIFALDESNEYIGMTNTTVIFDTNKEINIKCILALLNSKVLNYRYKYLGKQTGGGLFEYFENGVGKMPIANISTAIQEQLVRKIDKILEGNGSDISSLEKEIDQIVYKLYDLTEDEITIVEES